MPTRRIRAAITKTSAVKIQVALDDLKDRFEDWEIVELKVEKPTDSDVPELVIVVKG